jgi:hypothetical protein
MKIWTGAKKLFRSATFVLAVSSLVIGQVPVSHAESLYIISGTYTNRFGSHGSNPAICLDGSQGLSFNATVTTSDGITSHYTANVPSDVYKVSLCDYQGNEAYDVSLSSDDSTNSVDPFIVDATNGDATQDLQLDTVTLNVQMKDVDGNPIENGKFVARASRFGPGTTSLLVGRPDVRYVGDAYSENTVRSDVNGVTSAIVVRGLEYNICGVDPYSGEVSTIACANFIPTADSSSTVTLTFPPYPKLDAPTGLYAQSPTDQAPSLSWNEVSNARDYVVYRDGGKVASSTNGYTTYMDTSVSEGSYNYYIRAVTAGGGMSDPSDAVTVVYARDITAPTGLTAHSPTNQAPALTWNTVSGVNHYDVYRDGNNIGSTTNTTYSDTSANEGSHGYYIKAVNAASMSSDPSNSVMVVYDMTAPTINGTYNYL